jgi:hypothetical protein
MLFQEVGDAIADGGGFHVAAIVVRGAAENVDPALSVEAVSQTGMS